MKALSRLLAILFVAFCLSACKKNDEQPPAWIIGKWVTVKEVITDSKIGVTYSSVFTKSASDTTFDYEFFGDGTALQARLNPPIDPNFVTVGPISFNYHISGANMTVSTQYFIPNVTSFIITMHSSNEMELKGTQPYTDQSSGGKYAIVTILDFSKE